MNDQSLEIPYGPILMAILFNICLPTADIFTDIFTVIKAITFYNFSKRNANNNNLAQCGICMGEQHNTTDFDLCEWRKNGASVDSIAWLRERCLQVQILGSCMIIPILLNAVFDAIKWHQDYKNGKTSKATSILLLLLIYPQYSMAQIIYLHWKNPKVFDKLKLEWELELGSLEPIFESVFQVSSWQSV